MSLTPYDLELKPGPVLCTICGGEVTANHQAITYHPWSQPSLVVCDKCVPYVLGSLIQDWANHLEETWPRKPTAERRQRIIDAANRVAKAHAFYGENVYKGNDALLKLAEEHTEMRSMLESLSMGLTTPNAFAKKYAGFGCDTETEMYAANIIRAAQLYKDHETEGVQ